MEHSNKAYARDEGEGTELFPAKPTNTVKHNIANMGIGQTKLGSVKWIKRLLDVLRGENISELRDIIGTEENPITPDFINSRWHGVLKSIAGIRSDHRHKLSKRAYKACSLLQQCSIGNTSFLTVVTSLPTTRAGALRAVQEDGKKLQSLINRRFPNAVYIMVPEVDILFAKKVSAGLLADSRWKIGMSDNQIIYKVHFHGVIYVPSMLPNETQKAFQLTKTGKRSKKYAGANQVRAIPIRHENNDESSATPDVMNCIGYATKNFFKPPNLNRMTECFAEWVWLTHKITSDPSVIITGGTNRGIKLYCKDCGAHHTPDVSCGCNSITDVEIDDHVPNCDIVTNAISTSDNDSLISGASGSNNISNNLNCLSPSIWFHTGNVIPKEENGVDAVATSLPWQYWEMINPIRGP